MLFEPSGVRSVRIIYWKHDDPFPLEPLSKLIYQGLNLNKQARVAIMGETEALDAIPDHVAKTLDPRHNYHWSGAERRLELQKRLPRVLMGEYQEWFQWYMHFQRFKAFQTVIFIDPVSAVAENDAGGFINGLLVRLQGKVPQIVVVSRGTAKAPPQPDELHTKATLMALLYGTRMSRDQLLDATRSSFISIPDSVFQKALDDFRLQSRLHNGRYELTGDDEQLVQGMVPRWRPSGHGDRPDEIEQLFERRQRREYIKPELSWVKSEILKLAKAKGWFTSQSLYEHFRSRYGEFSRSTVPPPEEAYPDSQREFDNKAQIFLPSPSIIRKVCRVLVFDGVLSTHLWYREIGRPALVYAEPGRTLPFNERARCGQCSFYVGFKNRCQVWSLVYWKHRSWGFRWAGPRPEPNDFEMYKVRNSNRIGPHSSACRLFLDKKRDHLRKEIPGKCEVCAAALSVAKTKTVTCFNCGTTYSPWHGRAKVQTGYEHEFRRRYREVTGSDPEEDQRKQRLEWSNSPQRDIERMMELPPETDKRLEETRAELPLRTRPAFSSSLQHLVDEKARATDLAKILSLGMVRSAINATRRLTVVGRPDYNLVQEAIRRQETYLSLIRETNLGHLLTFEAHAMKEYWACYDAAIKPAQQWFGPRVRYRFVREYVGDPAGSAKGYSALHAAINYLHQRRLRQALRINAEVGFEGTSDGFLHGEKYNSRRTGLLFDMIDPFKFADREELLAIVLNRSITWRDFKMDSDRYNSTFYYPGSSARTILDRAGADADQLVVRYQGADSVLVEAYRQFATSLLCIIEGEGIISGFEAFAFTPV